MAGLGLNHIGGEEWMAELNAALDLINAASLTLPAASSAETIAGAISNKAVTPAGLATLTGTSTRSGLLQLASSAEALAGSDTAKALTAADLASVLTAIKVESFTGKNLTGACTLTGVKVGDLVLGVTGQGASINGDQSAKFESVITVNDQIQQSSNTDLHLNQYTAIIVHKS